MDIQTTKLEIMQLLLQTEEESILEKIKNIFKEKNILSEKEQKSIDLGLEDAKNEKLVPHSEAKKIYEKYL